MDSLIHGVSPALLAQILAELGPRYSWAFNSEPVCIVARMLQREIDGHGNTRSALRILQDTLRPKAEQSEYLNPTDEPN